MFSMFLVLKTEYLDFEELQDISRDKKQKKP